MNHPGWAFQPLSQWLRLVDARPIYTTSLSQTVMATITLRVLDGSDRGRVFEDLDPPVTIGREEGNTIQLNDERVSRFHLKIQEDHDKLVLTDLESTNGTKVNGETIQLRILRYGDMIAVGRSVLLFGSPHQIATRLATRAGGEDGTLDQYLPDVLPEASPSANGGAAEEADIQSTLSALDQPDLPQRLTPAQAAQLAEVIEYLHIRIRRLIASVQSEEESDRVTLDSRQWQHLLDLQARLASYLRSIADPE